MLLTLTMVDTRYMILVVLIVLSRVDSVVDLSDEMHFILLNFNIFPFQANWCFSACDCGV